MTSGPLSLLSGGWEGLLAFVLLAAALVVAIGLHEYAHALAADLQGDRLPRAMGRLTLNPLRHLDPLGSVLIVLVGFGWGKPVEFRPEALSSRRFGAAAVAVAGPFMNVALAIVGAFAFRGVVSVGPHIDFLFMFLELFIYINVALAVFNLLPIPPLDGSRLLTIFLPPGKQKIIYFLDRYGFLILLVVIFLAPSLLQPVIAFVGGIVTDLTGLS